MTAMAVTAPAWAASGNRNVLRFIPESGLIAPDPIAQTTIAGRAHGMMVWDQLYGQTSAGMVVPQMAEGHVVSADGLVWQITLREGITFHDGTPVTAADCAASIRRWGARRAFGQKLLERVERMTALDVRRLEIRLTRPYPLMLTALSGDLCFIMPEPLAASDPASPVARIIGSGPFRFLPDAFVPGARAAYDRFERYLPATGDADFLAGPKRALLERVEWTAMEPPAALAAIAAGEADWWENPPLELHDALREMAGVRLVANPQAGVIPILAFNHLVPPFSNRRLLRALLPALDQMEFMTAAMAGSPSLFRVGVGIFAPGSAADSDAGLEVLTGPRDVEAARTAVQESGYAGETVVLLSPTDLPRLRALTEVASDLFQRIGLIVEVVDMDWATLLQRRARREAPEAGGWSAFCTTFPSVALASPATHLPLRASPESSWFGWPTSAPLETLRDAWFDAPNKRARAKIAAEIQVAALHAVPFLPLGQWFGVSALREDVLGVGLTPYPVFWGVAKI
jgi:peptide/nickel transport system substrate-binding protein